MAWFEMLCRDTERLQDCRKRVNIMPLGAAALAGTTYPIDRDYTAELLGFERASRDEIDVIAAELKRLQSGLLDLAEREADTIMPGFTHLQTAQPVTFGHHLMAWFEM